MIIDADEIKKEFEGYNPENASQFHRESARLADKRFYETLKSGKYKEIIFTSGGTASGKSEFCQTYLDNNQRLIFDSTLSTIHGITIKLKKIAKYRLPASIYFIVPDSLGVAYITFLNRDRKFSSEHFVRTHVESRTVFLHLITSEDHPISINFHMIISSVHDKRSMHFTESSMPKELLIEVAKGIQISRQDLLEIVDLTNNSDDDKTSI